MRVCKFLIDLTHHDRGIPRRFVVPVGVIEFQHFLLSGCVRGRRFVRGRLGSGGFVCRRFCRRRLLPGAAGHQRAKHRKRQKQSKYSFHHWFVLLFCYLQVFLHDTYSTRFCPPSQWTALRCACVLFCPCAARAVFSHPARPDFQRLFTFLDFVFLPPRSGAKTGQYFEIRDCICRLPVLPPRPIETPPAARYTGRSNVKGGYYP